MSPTARRRRGSAEQYSSIHSLTAWQRAPARPLSMRPLTVSAIWVPKMTATSMPSRSMSSRRSTGSVMPGRPFRASAVMGPDTPGPGPSLAGQIRPSSSSRLPPRLSLSRTGASALYFSGSQGLKSMSPSLTWPSASMTRVRVKSSMNRAPFERPIHYRYYCCRFCVKMPRGSRRRRDVRDRRLAQAPPFPWTWTRTLRPCSRSRT